MAAADDYPTIDPTTFDVIAVGTGLPSSIIAAAAASAGKSVLHVDPNPFYGSHFTSLPPSSLSSILSPQSNFLELSGSLPEPSGTFSLDLAGPRLLFCADQFVDLLVRSGASNHVGLKSIDGSLIYSDGALSLVPDSREAIFRDKSLGLVEKRVMTKFLKLVKGHIGNEEGARVSEEELEMPFVEFLKKQSLSPKIRAFILYAIVLADYDQENREGCKKLIKTKEGIEALALYINSVARYPNAVGAFMYPMYGHGELPQAFCRCAAVKGALYVLRMPVVDLLIDEESKKYNGVKLTSSQEIFSKNLIMEPTTIPASILPLAENGGLGTTKETLKVARGICITNCSIQQDLLNVLVIFPPRSLCPEQSTTVRALQLSSNLSVCPPGMFVVYLSTPCDDATSGKEYLRAAMNALFSIPNLNATGGSTSSNEEAAEQSKATLLWSALYVQDVEVVQLIKASLDTCCFCPMPDPSLDYNDLVESTMELFTRMYPQEDFLPAVPDPERAEN